MCGAIHYSRSLTKLIVLVLVFFWPVIRSVTRVLSSLQIAFEGYQGLVGCHRQRPRTRTRTRTIKKTRTIIWQGTIKPDVAWIADFFDDVSRCLERSGSLGKEMLQRIVAMLTRLVDRFDTGEIRVRGESPPSSQSFP